MLVRFALAIAFFAILTPLPATAELDGERLSVLGAHGQPLRWDNAVLPPYWLDGTGSKGRRLDRNPSLLLEPGQDARFVLPPRTVMRVTAHDARLDTADLLVRLDNGSGLELEYPAQTSHDGTSLVIAPESSQTLLVRLARPRSRSAPLAITPYVSRREPWPNPVGARRTVPLNVPIVTIQREDLGDDEPFYRVDAGVPCTTVVTGPARLKLDSLLRYAPGEQQIEQTYTIHARVSGQPARNILCHSTADTRHHWSVDNRQAMLGYVEHSFVTIPAGEHRVEFESTVGIYLQLTMPRFSEYALPRINASAKRTPKGSLANLDRARPWNFTQADFADFAWDAILFPALAERLAYRLAHDNRFSDGGLQAALLMRETAILHPELPELQRRAEQYRGWHTFYRDLPLTRVAGSRCQRYGWFSISALADQNGAGNASDETDLVLLEDHADDALDRLSLARFLPVGATREEANVYRRPIDRSTSLLQVAIAKSCQLLDQPVYLQFDERPPIRLSLCPCQEPTGVPTTVSIAEAALAVSKHRHQAAGRGTLGGPFARFRSAAPLVNVAHAELLLPGEVSEIRLWSTAAYTAEVHVALRERVSRPFRLSETQLIRQARVIGCDLAVSGLAEFVGSSQPKESSQFMGSSQFVGPGRLHAHHEVINHFAGWYRQQESIRRWYTESIAAPDAMISEAPTASRNPATSETFTGLEVFMRSETSTSREAETPTTWQAPETAGLPKNFPNRLVQHQEPELLPSLDALEGLRESVEIGSSLAVLEDASRVLQQVENETDRRRALLKRADALADLKETFLYERQLRGMFLFSQDPLVRSEAQRRLHAFYSQRNDLRSLQAMYSILVSRDEHVEDAPNTLTDVPNTLTDRPDALAELARLQLRDGDAAAALDSAWMLPPERRPLDIVLRATYQVRWWQTFQSHLAMVDVPEQRAFWEAQRALTRGEYEWAATRFQQAGGPGSKYLQHLHDGLALVERLSSQDPVARARAVLDWERWQAGHPGPYVWRAEPTLVTEYASAARLQAIELGRGTEYFVARPLEPVRLVVQGPVRLKLDMRPVHALEDGEKPLDDWVEIRAAGRLWPVAVLGNRPSRGLSRVEAPNRPVGTRVEFEFTLGPGRHALTVAPREHELLLRPLAWRPEIPLPVLPRLGTDVVHAVLAGNWGETASPRNQEKNAPKRVVRMVRGSDEGFVDIPLVDYQRLRWVFWDMQILNLSESLAARIMLRLKRSEPASGDTPPNHLDALVKLTTDSSISIGERLLAAEAAGILDRMPWPPDVADASDVTISDANASDIAAMLTACNKPLGAATWPAMDDSPEAIWHRMNSWLYLADRYPQSTPLYRAMGEALIATMEPIADVGPIYRKLLAGTTWEPVTNVQQSAGIHRVRVAGLATESPSQRVRNAMLGPLTPGDYRLTGDQTLALSLKNLRPSDMRMTFHAEHLEFLPPGPIEIEWQVDDQSPRHRRLLPRAGHQATARVERGDHLLRIRLVNPYVNQFVRVRLEERIDGGASRAYAPILREIQRDYFIATRTEPIRWNVSGPAWLRIDQRVGDSTLSRYEAVFAENQTVTVRPPEGDEHGLYRIFARRFVSSASDPQRPMLTLPRTIVPVAGPLMTRYRHVGRVPIVRHGEATPYPLPEPSVPESSLPELSLPELSLLQASRTRLQNADNDNVPQSNGNVPQSNGNDGKVTFARLQNSNDDDDEHEFPARLPPVTETAEFATPTHLDRLDLSATQPPAIFGDAFPLGRQHWGTWSLDLGWRQRRPLEESSGESRPDEFFQFGATHRYFDPLGNIYSTTSMAYRDRSAGGSFGLTSRLRHDSNRWPVICLMDTRAYVQSPGQAILPQENDTEWSVYWRGTILSRRQIAPEWWHTPTCSVFARGMSLDANPYPTGRVDQDIYTPYKADHRFGLLMADTLTWQPWSDTQFRLRGSLGSNEDFNPVRPDYLSTRLSWRQLVGPIDFETGYRCTHYFGDSDRHRAATKHVLGIDLTWDVWTPWWHFGEMDVFYHHDLGTGASSLGVAWSFYLDAGRGYRDFAPDQTRFKAPKRRREWLFANNRIDLFSL